MSLLREKEKLLYVENQLMVYTRLHAEIRKNIFLQGGRTHLKSGWHQESLAFLYNPGFPRDELHGAPPGSSWLILAPPGSSWLLLAPPGS